MNLDIEIQFTSWVFPRGHRIRLAVSNSQWPMLWPTPFPMTSTLALGGAGGSQLVLPVIPAGASGAEQPVPDFKVPAENPGLPGYETLDSGNISGYGEIEAVQHDPDTGEAFGVASNSGKTRYPWGVKSFEERIEHRTSDVNPGNTSVRGIYALTQELEDRTLRFEQDVIFSSDRENFRMIFKRRVMVDGELKHEKQWDELIPRDFQ